MSDTIKILSSIAGTSILSNSIWDAIPGSKAFATKVLSQTSPTGEPQKSPLAFIEHHHWDMGLLLISDKINNITRADKKIIIDGMGIGFILSEVLQDKPFGLNKTEGEMRGNILLTMALGGALLIKYSGDKSEQRTTF